MRDHKGVALYQMARPPYGDGSVTTDWWSAIQAFSVSAVRRCGPRRRPVKAATSASLQARR